jgi:hypothetical protein
MSAGKPVASQLRQRHFDKLPNLAAAHFSTEHVYTFVIGQSILDMMQYRLSLGGLLNLDLCPILNGQPLQMMCKNIKVRQLHTASSTGFGGGWCVEHHTSCWSVQLRWCG